MKLQIAILILFLLGLIAFGVQTEDSNDQQQANQKPNKKPNRKPRKWRLPSAFRAQMPLGVNFQDFGELSKSQREARILYYNKEGDIQKRGEVEWDIFSSGVSLKLKNSRGNTKAYFQEDTIFTGVMSIFDPLKMRRYFWEDYKITTKGGKTLGYLKKRIFVSIFTVGADAYYIYDKKGENIVGSFYLQRDGSYTEVYNYEDEIIIDITNHYMDTDEAPAKSEHDWAWMVRIDKRQIDDRVVAFLPVWCQFKQWEQWQNDEWYD